MAEAIRSNGLTPALYVEPFAGGASVALQLLQDGVVSEIGLADRDPLVASFWSTVFYDSDWLVDQINSIEVSLGTWHEIKQSAPTSTREMALKCLYLNRTSFSGILRGDAGPIGGYTQSSDYGIDCRFPRDTLVRRVKQAAALSGRVAFIWMCSWDHALMRIQEEQKKRHLPSGADAFYYFDPPFFEKANRLYNYHFTAKDHVILRDALIMLEEPWLLSYDRADMAMDLYSGTNLGSTQVEILYSVASTAGQRAAREIVLTNLPELPTATRLWRNIKEWRQNGNGKN